MSDNRDEPYYVLPNSFEEEEAREWGRDETSLVERVRGELLEGNDHLHQRRTELEREAPGVDETSLVERVRAELLNGNDQLVARQEQITVRNRMAQEFQDRWQPRIDGAYPSGGSPEQKIAWWLKATADLVQLTFEIAKQHLAEREARGGRPLTPEERRARDRRDLEQLKKHPAFAKLQKGSRSAKIKAILPSDRELLGDKRKWDVLGDRAKAAFTGAVRPKGEPKPKRENAGWSLNGPEKFPVDTQKMAAAAATLAAAATALQEGVKALGAHQAAAASQTALSQTPAAKAASRK